MPKMVGLARGRELYGATGRFAAGLTPDDDDDGLADGAKGAAVVSGEMLAGIC